MKTLQIINEEENYRRLKEDTSMIKSQRSDKKTTEKKQLIEEGKIVGINKIIRKKYIKLKKSFFF